MTSGKSDWPDGRSRIISPSTSGLRCLMPSLGPAAASYQSASGGVTPSFLTGEIVDLVFRPVRRDSTANHPKRTFANARPLD